MDDLFAFFAASAPLRATVFDSAFHAMQNFSDKIVANIVDFACALAKKTRGNACAEHRSSICARGDAIQNMVTKK
jgi:hypothetical protein